MPKLKIRKSVADRFKITKNGKVLRRIMGHRHLKSNKRKTCLYRGKKPILVVGKIEKKIKKLLGK